MPEDTDPVAARIGGNIRRYRLALGLSQNAVAKRAPGISGGDQVAKYERGEARPRPAAFYGLATALEIEPEDLLDPPQIADARARAVEAARRAARRPPRS